MFKRASVWEKISPGVPSAKILPSWRTMMREAISAISSIEWETMIMVLPSLFIFTMVSTKLRRARGSRPAVGSSRMRVCGFIVRILAIAILRF